MGSSVTSSLLVFALLVVILLLRAFGQFGGDVERGVGAASGERGEDLQLVADESQLSVKHADGTLGGLWVAHRLHLGLGVRLGGVDFRALAFPADAFGRNDAIGLGRDLRLSFKPGRGSDLFRLVLRHQLVALREKRNGVGEEEAVLVAENHRLVVASELREGLTSVVLQIRLPILGGLGGERVLQVANPVLLAVHSDARRQDEEEAEQEGTNESGRVGHGLHGLCLLQSVLPRGFLRDATSTKANEPIASLGLPELPVQIIQAIQGKAGVFNLKSLESTTHMKL